MSSVALTVSDDNIDLTIVSQPIEIAIGDTIVIQQGGSNLSQILTATDQRYLKGLPTLPAAQTISALRIVSRTGNTYDLTNLSSASSVWAIAGLAVSSASAGDTIKPVREEFVTDSGWNWNLNAPIFLGTNGTLTQSAPSVDYRIIVARPSTPTTIFVSIEEPIKL